MTDSNLRLQQIRSWLKQTATLEAFKLTPVSGDASFRRYFRVATATDSYIVMDAPPDRENCESFLLTNQKLALAGLNVPHVYAADTAAGILLLGDLGDDLYLQHLDTNSSNRLYGDAMDALMRIQSIDPAALPTYDDDLLMREMELFPEWFLGKHLQIAASSQQYAVLQRTFAELINLAHEQPCVFVHRDYHSRNLMVTPENSPGILDFQDAVRGPLTYDLVSLLRDSYIAWPRPQVIDWALQYRDRIVAAGILTPTSDRKFIRWLELMGIQRQLKVCGIFARLYHRDGKTNYLKDIPLTFRYLMDASARYPETEELHAVLNALKLSRILFESAS